MFQFTLCSLCINKHQQDTSSLLQKHFPKYNRLLKIFNKNNKAISYSCMCDISSIIAVYIKSLLQPKVTEHGCKHRVKYLSSQESVPNSKFNNNIQSKCWRWNQRWNKDYFGLAGTTFKERFGNHKKDFKPRQHTKNIELSKYISSLKDRK